MSQLTGRTVVVTGGAQGIGAAIAQTLAARGAHVAIGDLRPPEEVVAAIESSGGSASGGVCDIADPDSVSTFVDSVVATGRGIDGLVNNAALFSALPSRPFEQIPSAEFDRVLQVNVRGTFEMTRAVVPAMRAQGYGKIVNLGSGTFFKGVPYLLHYVASKGAVVAMTRALARELGPAGIRVNCLAPGLTMSDGVRETGNTPAEHIAADVRTRALQRQQEPDDLVGTVAFLLCADSDFMTGQTVVVDGGSHLH